MPGSIASEPVFTLRSIAVFADRAEALVACPEPLRTSGWPGLADSALGLLPGLAEHDCDNDEGLPFAAELDDTELAHLFEHVAIELRLLAGAHRRLRGETSWDFPRDGRGVFRVRVGVDEDAAAWTEAFRGAERVLRWLTAGSADEVERAGGDEAVAGLVADVRAAGR
jgi:hypothetical protein